MNKGFTLIETLVSLSLVLLAVLFSARVTAHVLAQERNALLRFRLIESLDYYKNYLTSLAQSAAELAEGGHRQQSRGFDDQLAGGGGRGFPETDRPAGRGGQLCAACRFFQIKIHPGGTKMIKGFGILEMLLALSLGLGILTVIIAHSAESGKVARKVTVNQERLEAIFHTVDTIKSDLNKCGMRLQEARQSFPISCFSSAAGSFWCEYGLADELLLENAARGQQTLKVARNEYFKKDKAVLIYNLALGVWEFNEIRDCLGGALVLKNAAAK